jgi:hypothetical protein
MGLRDFRGIGAYSSLRRQEKPLYVVTLIWNGRAFMTERRRKRKLAAGWNSHPSLKPADGEERDGNLTIPLGAIPADSAQQVPNNSYSHPPAYYVDREFICVDCKRREIWTATQQKWYYEVAKGSLYSTAVRCRACRRKRREVQGDPNPIKHLGSLMKQLRNRIDPWLTDAGFCFDRRSGKDISRSMWIEYAKSDKFLRVSFDANQGHLVADMMDEFESRRLVDIQLTGGLLTSAQIVERLDRFAVELRTAVTDV